MSGVESCCLEFVLSVFKFKSSVLTADDVELTDHFVVIDQVFRVEIEGQYSSACLVPSHAFLELSLTVSLPRTFQI